MQVELNKNNYLLVNPIAPFDIKVKSVKGRLHIEKFYLIDFWDIKNDEYIITSYGRIFSLSERKELECNKDKNGYTVVSLELTNGKCKKFVLHRLVATAFIPKTEDDIRLNRNYVFNNDPDTHYCWNLEWRTSSEINIIYRTKNSISRVDTVKFVCKLLERKVPSQDIFRIINRKLSVAKINQIKNKRAYVFVSKDYNF